MKPSFSPSASATSARLLWCSPNWSGVALSGCDMTLQNSVNVTANLYVLGNLCFQNTAKMNVLQASTGTAQALRTDTS